jgi:hypothetical protein
MPAITNVYRTDRMPDGNLALEVGDLDAVLILTAKEARKLATIIRTTLCGDDLADLLAERARINQAIAWKRRQWMQRRARGQDRAPAGAPR